MGDVLADPGTLNIGCPEVESRTVPEFGSAATAGAAATCGAVSAMSARTAASRTPRPARLYGLCRNMGVSLVVACSSEARPPQGRRRSLTTGTDPEFLYGEFFALGARAVADLAESARARRDEAGELHVVLARDRLVTALADMGGRPLADHPYAARIPGDRADWNAELGRSVGRNDPDAWQEAAVVWQRLGRPHRTAYALWRQAEALMTRSAATNEAAIPLRAAAQAANGMAPLMREIQRLAERARISLGPVDQANASPPRPVDRYDLTKRERLVLRLLAKGYTNARIGAELFVSPKTASVHVTNILRKLNVLNRTEAAAVAERAGLIEEPGV